MSDRLTNQGLKLWAQYYARMAGVRAWNGFLTWFRVTVSTTVVAGSTGLVDVRQIGWKGGLAILAGTILLSIAEGWFKAPLPEPTPPPPTP